MLYRCVKCGRPVYFPEKGGMQECGFCYHRQFAGGADYRMNPGKDSSWRRPVMEAARGGRNQEQWLILLGDEETYRTWKTQREEQEKHWMLMLAESEDALSKENNQAHLTNLICRFAWFPEREEARVWKEKLEKKLEVERLRETLTPIQRKIANTASVSELEICERELRDLETQPGCAALAAEVQQELEDCIRKRKEIQKKEKKAQRKRVWRPFAILAAASMAFGIYILISIFVVQPGRLQRARELAKENRYEEAVEAYQKVEDAGYVRWGTLEAAKKERKALQISEAEKMLSQGKYAEAASLFVAAGDSNRAQDAYRTLADSLMAGGEYESAAAQYTKAKDEEGAINAWTARAEELTAQGDLSGAIACWEQVPDSEDRIQTLYTEMTLQLVSQKDWKDALDAYDKADREALEAQGVTELSLQIALAEELISAGDVQMAARILSPVWQEDAKAKELYLQVKMSLLEDALPPALVAWQAADESGKDAQQRKIRKIAEDYPEIDLQLRAWTMMDAAGMDLQEMFPDGAVVSGLVIPEQREIKEDADWTRPLVFVRVEKEYSVSSMIALKEIAQHDQNSETAFTLRMLPETWQSLPAERRPASLAECTEIALLNQTYEYLGTVSATTITWDYVYSNVNKEKYPTKTFTWIASLPSYRAVQESLHWHPGSETASCIERLVTDPEHKPVSGIEGILSSLTVDWREHPGFASTVSLGLAPAFDKDWNNAWREKMNLLVR